MQPKSIDLTSASASTSRVMLDAMASQRPRASQDTSLSSSASRVAVDSWTASSGSQCSSCTYGPGSMGSGW